MTRVLLLLSLVLLIVSGWFVYSQGLVGRVFNPTVIVVRANEDIARNHRIQPSMVRATEAAVAEIPPGTLAFPRGATSEQIARVLGSGRALGDIPRDTPLGGQNFGPAVEVWQIRTLASFAAGDSIQTSDLEPVLVDAPEGGKLSFESRAAADAYLRERSAMHALVDLEPGAMIGSAEASSNEGGVIYVLETRAAMETDSVITNTDVQVVQMVSSTIPRGSIAFARRSDAEIFVSASADLALAVDVPANAILDVSMLRQPTAERTLRDWSDPAAPLPDTLLDLLDMQTQDPFAIKLINLAAPNPDIDVEPSVALVGAAPMDNETMDLWVEVGRTEGSFGTITLRRFVRGITIRKVVDPDLVLASMQRQMAVASQEVSGATDTPPAAEAPEVRGIFYWANITREGGLAIEEAKRDERLVFAMSANTPISEFLGNGVTCGADRCSVSINASNNLAPVRAAIDRFMQLNQPELVEVAQEDGEAPDVMTVIDGVSTALQEGMYEAGYTTYESVALWDDGDLGRIAAQLGIVVENVQYIRAQARELLKVPNRAREQLGQTSSNF